MQSQLAVGLNQRGKPVHEIAQRLDGTPDEVRSWIRNSPRQDSSANSMRCDVCGMYIGDNIPYEKADGGRYCHVRCPEN
jgi:hypothetical protein